jgi:hypothetical protein
VINLYDELIAVTRALREQSVEYAVCGGMAMAIHSVPRTTVDIDLLIRPEDAPRALDTARSLGYLFEARPMSLANGAIEIRRISKMDPDTHDPLMLDFLLVTQRIEDVWATREVALTNDGEISVVSREGLAKLKAFRSAGRDLDDIALLRGEHE